MSNRTDAVDRYLDALVHPRKQIVIELRDAILASNPGITERIKWNAPSFCYASHDRITFRLHPGNRVQLIFHRGVTPKDTSGFSFADPDGWLTWAAPDRGVLTIPPVDHRSDRTAAIVLLANRWMLATTPD